MLLNKTLKEKFWNNFLKWLSLTLSISFLSKTQLWPRHWYWQYCWAPPSNDSYDWDVASVLPAVPLYATIRNLTGSSSGTYLPSKPHPNGARCHTLLSPSWRSSCLNFRFLSTVKPMRNLSIHHLGLSPKSPLLWPVLDRTRYCSELKDSPCMCFYEPFAKQERRYHWKCPSF